MQFEPLMHAESLKRLDGRVVNLRSGISEAPGDSSSARKHSELMSQPAGFTQTRRKADLTSGARRGFRASNIV